MVKVAFVIYDYAPRRRQQEDCLETARELCLRGHEVHIFTRTWQGIFPRGIKVHRLGRVGQTTAAQNLHFIESLEEAFNECLVDGIIAFHPIPKCNIYFPREHSIAGLSRTERKNEKMLFRQSPPPTVFCKTQLALESYRSEYKIKQTQLSILPPNIRKVTRSDAEKAQNRSDIRSEYNVPSGQNIALYVASNLQETGLERCLGATSANTPKYDIELWVLGSGDPGKHVPETTQNALKVRFLGGRSDTERFYDAADILLHPTINEDADKVLLEAITHGLPVITTNRSGYTKHIKESGAAIIVEEPFNQSEYNKMVSHLIAHKDLRDELSKNGLRYAATHDLYSNHVKIAQQIEAILRT